jgi:hypothetical protein
MQRNWVYEKGWKRREVVLTKPFRSADGKFIWYTVLFLR